MFVVKPSRIRNAGNGLFATVDIPKGTRLGEYTGKKLSHAQLQKLKDRSYVFEVKTKRRTFYIDGKQSTSLLPKMNSAKTFLQMYDVNCYTYQHNERIYFKTARDVKRGEELIRTYGEDYWA